VKESPSARRDWAWLVLPVRWGYPATGSLFPLSWQDGFRNDLGYLNFVAPTVAVLPPFDLVWRVVAAPVREVLGSQDPIFQTREHIPYRVLSVASGLSKWTRRGLMADGDRVRRGFSVPAFRRILAQ
jgi:hypothetical protein